MKRTGNFFWIICCTLLLLLGYPVRTYSIKNAVVYENAAQQEKVNGTVKDSNNQPLIGVSVLVKGTSIGTVTNVDGIFSIEANRGDVIVLSYLGFQTREIVIENTSPLNVTMKEDTQQLDEVVVVGFGTQKKVNLTGSVGSVNGEAFEDVPVQNAVQALQGHAGGLNISYKSGGALNNKADMNVRGTGTIGMGSTGNALVLIDGMEGDLYSINPQDIESVSILKDAASSSIYGSRAPFGVILVTTKSGKKNSKMSINYNNSFRYSTPINMPEMMDSYTFATYFNDASTAAGWQPVFDEERMKRIKDFMDGKITSTTIPKTDNPTLWGDGYDYGNDNVDYYDVFYKKWTFSQEHNLSIDGGSDKVSYFLSANYLGQDGLLNAGNDSYKRYTVSGKFNANLSKILSVGYSAKFIRTDYTAPTAMNDYFFSNIGHQSWPVKPLYDPNGYLFDDHVLQLKNGGDSKEQCTYVIQQFNVKLEPIDGWRFIGDVNYRHENMFKNSVIKTVHQMGVDGKREGAAWNQNNDVWESVNAHNYLNASIYTEFEKEFSGHYLKAMVGSQIEEYKSRNMAAERQGLIVPDLGSLNTTTGSGPNGQAVAPQVQGSYADWATAGFFGRVNYNYKEKYLAEFNIRYDGSSRFRGSNRWGTFPSMSVGWNMAREDFFNRFVNVCSTLKLRISYGMLGNQNTTSYYPTYSTMGLDVGGGSWLINGAKTTHAWAPSLISYDLSWEKIKVTNLGLDWGMFDNRLTGSFDYFIRRTDDMVGPAEELPAILGTAVPRTNNTNLKTWGFELEISWKDRLANGLGYSASFILSDSQSKITKYSNPTGSLSSYRKGQMMGEIWGYTTKGIARTDQEMEEHLASLPNGGQDRLGQDWKAGDIMYEDINKDGVIGWGESTISDPGDRSVIGNATPRFNYGFDLAADWKGFDFRMFLQGVMKRDYYQGSKHFWGALGSGARHWGSMGLKQHEDYFRDDPNHPLGLNTDSYYPRALFGTGKNQQCQSRYVLNASYLRVKNLQLGYTLPRKYLSSLGVEKLRVYVSGENLLTFTKLPSMFDPETIEGIDNTGSAYPLSATYSFGLNIIF